MSKTYSQKITFEVFAETSRPARSLIRKDYPCPHCGSQMEKLATVSNQFGCPQCEQTFTLEEE